MTRILIVEDDADLQRLLALTLSREGWDVHYAYRGPEGFEKAVSLLPQIILCDMMLPGYGGVELIRRLKANPATREVPIVVMTAYYGSASFVESEIRKLGIIEYLRKPFKMSDLVRLLRGLIEGLPAPPPARPAVKRGCIRLEPVSRGVWVDDKLVATPPPIRFAVLLALVESAGPIDCSSLMKKIWRRDDCKGNLEKTIERLREDLGEASRRLRTTAEGYEVDA